MRRRLIPPQQPFLGMGTSGSPYRIATAEQLADLATKVNAGATDTLRGGLYREKHYLQVAHLDLSAYANFNPIGALSSVFSGVYDGNGFRIYALNTSQRRAGLFGTIENATVKNVAIVCTAGCTISTTADSTAWAGAIVAYIIGNSTISGCTNTATVINIGTAGNCFSGGIVGYSYTTLGYGVFDCANFGAVQQNATTTGQKYCGGICGFKVSNTVITRCLNAGAITTTAGTIRAICGQGNPSNSYYDSDTSLVGGQTGATGLTTAQCTGAAAQTNMPNLDWVNVWRTNEGGYPTLRVFDK